MVLKIIQWIMVLRSFCRCFDVEVYGFQLRPGFGQRMYQSLQRPKLLQLKVYRMKGLYSLH